MRIADCVPNSDYRMPAACLVAISRWWFPNCFVLNIKFKTRIFILINYVYVFNDIKKIYI